MSADTIARPAENVLHLLRKVWRRPHTYQDLWVNAAIEAEQARRMVWYTVFSDSDRSEALSE